MLHEWDDNTDNKSYKKCSIDYVKLKGNIVYFNFVETSVTKFRLRYIPLWHSGYKINQRKTGLMQDLLYAGL